MTFIPFSLTILNVKLIWNVIWKIYREYNFELFECPIRTILLSIYNTMLVYNVIYYSFNIEVEFVQDP